MSEDALEWTFTNKKKQGGGEIKSLELDTYTRSAVIEFKKAGGKLYFQAIKMYDSQYNVPSLKPVKLTSLAFFFIKEATYVENKIQVWHLLTDGFSHQIYFDLFSFVMYIV